MSNKSTQKPTLVVRIKRRVSQIKTSVAEHKKAAGITGGSIVATATIVTLLFSGSGTYTYGTYEVEQLTQFSSHIELQLPEDFQADTVDLYVGETPIVESANVGEGVYVLPAILNPLDQVTLYFVKGRDLHDQAGNLVESSKMAGKGWLEPDGKLKIEFDANYQTGPATGSDTETENEGGGSQ